MRFAGLFLLLAIYAQNARADSHTIMETRTEDTSELCGVGGVQYCQTKIVFGGANVPTSDSSAPSDSTPVDRAPTSQSAE